MELGLSGYARNLPDGRVEVLVVGEPAAVQSLIDWLARPAGRAGGSVEVEIELEELASAGGIRDAVRRLVNGDSRLTGQRV